REVLVEPRLLVAQACWVHRQRLRADPHVEEREEVADEVAGAGGDREVPEPPGGIDHLPGLLALALPGDVLGEVPVPLLLRAVDVEVDAEVDAPVPEVPAEVGERAVHVEEDDRSAHSPALHARSSARIRAHKTCAAHAATRRHSDTHAGSPAATPAPR